MSLLDGLIAYYKLDGNANDELGNYNGTPNNVSWVDGKIDKSGSFNGSNSKITLGSLRLDDRSFSISFWASNTQTSSSNSYVIGQDASSNGKSLHIGRRNNGKFTFAFYSDDLDSSNNMATDGTWEHWVCTFDNSNRARKIYRNGVLNASDTSSAKFTGTAQLNIGYAMTSYWFKGLIDEVAIYDRALTPQEISKLYNSGDGLSYPFTKGMRNIFIGGKKVIDMKFGSKQIKEVYKGDKLIWSIKMDAGLKSGLIAYYTLDGDANDSLGANNGTASNVSWVDGKIDKAGSFSNSTISINSLSSLFGGTNSHSVSMWVNWSGFSDFRIPFTSCVSSGGSWKSRGLVLQADADAKIVAKRYSGGSDKSIQGITASQNTWYHLVATYDGSTLKFYINNNLQGTISVGTSGTQAVAVIGKDISNGGPHYFQGLIDEVGIWNRALTQEEITKLYNNGNGLTY